ncbi:hypothetical protein ACF5W4_11285 [Bacillota bacterium Lsc_1132]
MANEQVKDQIALLINQFGEADVVAAAETLITAAKGYQVPTQFAPVIAPEKLADTVAQLDASVSDIIEKAQGREKAYGEKLSLLKRKRELETAIELKESEAIMNIRGESRSQYVMVNGEKISLTNEESRKAYARMAAQEERKQMAEVESELLQLEQKSFWAKDEYEAAVKAGDQVQAKAYVQAGLLNLLGRN